MYLQQILLQKITWGITVPEEKCVADTCGNLAGKKESSMVMVHLYAQELKLSCWQLLDLETAAKASFSPLCPVSSGCRGLKLIGLPLQFWLFSLLVPGLITSLIMSVSVKT